MVLRVIHIRDGVIENVSLSETLPEPRDGLTFEEDPGGVGPGHRLVDGEWVPPPPPVPQEVTLSDWRVALIKMGRFNEVATAVAGAKASGTPEGLIADTRFEYANHVYRDELLQMAPLFGFSEQEVDASLLVAAGYEPPAPPAGAKRKKAKR